MNQILTDEEITLIIRECARGSAINRDGSTSHRIARAIEQAILNKLSEQEPVGYLSADREFLPLTTRRKDIAPLYLHPAPSVPEGYVVVPIEPTPKIKAAMCSVLLDDKEAQFCYDLSWEEATELYKKALQQGVNK